MYECFLPMIFSMEPVHWMELRWKGLLTSAIHETQGAFLSQTARDDRYLTAGNLVRILAGFIPAMPCKFIGNHDGVINNTFWPFKLAS